MTTETQALSEFDWMELIAFDSKANREGFTYTYEEYGPRFESAELRTLAEDMGAFRRFYRSQSAAIESWWQAHREDGCDLHNAHCAEADRRRRDSYLWGARCENGNVLGRDTEARARWLIENQSWRCTQLLRRDEPGGEWILVEDFAGLEQDGEWLWLRAGDSVLVDGQWVVVAASEVEVRDYSAEGGSKRTSVRVTVLADGRRVDTGPSWRGSQPVRYRRRTAVPADLTAQEG